ncbi:MAG: acyltransferase [Bacteroidales bacterium]|jgi:phenylacetate-coenzyme A ligase PaaK-like adenylate-forming protein|nr:acyltransferase [Bacteroidales bacterium]MDD3330615.1 acyltransferase [Bacteroidales bacterium]MDD3691462.1 acyltransferase [Bacteroidales bacterium]MDD4044603.1 acyltransferase [Bacteroidales bacterium]MDD4581657.1 acyltransferase [Bacteroidales bacterium]
METLNPLHIFTISTPETFRQTTIKVFRFQYAHCDIYRQYVDAFLHDIDSVKSIEQIPFLPIEFFKTHRVVSSLKQEEVVFVSSGTSTMPTSRHYVVDLGLYEESFLRAFRLFVGNPEDFAILSLLPSYMERGNSSLLYMMQRLMQLSKHPFSKFYLHHTGELVDNLQSLAAEKHKTILWGVSYALLDMVEKHCLHLPDLIVFETGGMKGRREELLREALHQRLKEGFGIQAIYSEYGMTELLSQAYTCGHARFYCPPWMQIRIRDIYNPLHILSTYGKNGAINVIDLANLYSCSFIATSDIGKLYADHSFEVLGRMDHSDVRGCNLLVHE